MEFKAFFLALLFLSLVVPAMAIDEDTKANTLTVTVKEDVKGAIIQILTAYADRCPVGKPTTGTKE